MPASISSAVDGAKARSVVLLAAIGVKQLVNSQDTHAVAQAPIITYINDDKSKIL